MAPQRILIVGCGIAGPTLATFLLRSSLPILDKPKITILERSSAPRSQGQNVDIRGIGLTIIRKLGLEEEIRASTTGEKGVQWVTKDNKVWASFGAGPDEKIHSPTSDMEIMRGQLADICLKRSERESDEVKGKGGEGIEYIFGDYIQEIEQYQSEVTVRFAKSRERRVFDLVVGADGLQSQLRKMVWGAHAEREHLKRLDMYAAFFSIPHAQTDTMWRRCFHTSGRRVIMVRPSKQSDRTTVLLTVINDRDERLPDAATSGSKDAETQKRLIEDYFANAGWETDRILREMKLSKDFYYDMVAQVKMSDWSKGNVVLLGDAAHCTSHLSGLGTTLALYGAYNLAGALLAHPDDTAVAISEYQMRTRPSVDRAQKLMPGMLRILSPETAWGVWVVDTLIKILIWSRVGELLLRLKGADTETEAIHDYGI